MQRILIIEDDAAIAHLMESTLRREQYNTIWAADGVQGADLFETGHFDLTGSDVAGYQRVRIIGVFCAKQSAGDHHISYGTGGKQNQRAENGSG